MSFDVDNTWQREKRDEVLAPGFYDSYAVNGRYVFLDKGRLATLLQKRFAVDTLLQKHDGTALCIEEKIVRWPGYQYASFCLETQSCTVPGRESHGWMHYGEADFLLYCFEMHDGSLDSWLMDFPKLKAWFWPKEKDFSQFGPVEPPNFTIGRLVPIKLVHAAVPSWRWRVTKEGSTYIPRKSGTAA